MSRAVASLVVTAGLLLGLPAGGAPGAPPAQQGQSIFQQKCVSCHTIGQGDRVGPDLKGVTTRRDGAYLKRFISVPDRVLAEKDPTATKLLEKYNGVAMPNLGLTKPEVDALIAYLTAQAAGPPPRKPARPAPSAGSAAAGKNLFSGSTRLANGGAPCLSCHTIAGIGTLGGGALGPDLTRAYAKYGSAAGVASILATLPFPTMRPIFQNHPLTAAEQADLSAFLKQAAGADRPGSAVWRLLLLAAAGVAAFFALALLVWPRRGLAVRRTLTTRPKRG